MNRGFLGELRAHCWTARGQTTGGLPGNCNALLMQLRCFCNSVAHETARVCLRGACSADAERSLLTEEVKVGCTLAMLQWHIAAS